MPSLPVTQNEQSGPMSDPRTLKLPASIISVLSPKQYLLAHLQADPPIRPSGRAPSDFQNVAVNTSSLTNCLGSAVVRSGNTAVVCGIHVETLSLSDIADPYRVSGNRTREDDYSKMKDSTAEISHLQLLVPNVDLATGCSKDHVPGQAPNAVAQSITQRLYRLLLATDLVNVEDLRVVRPVRTSELEDEPATESETDVMAASATEAVETIGYFVLYLHFSVLSLDGQNSLLASLWIALLAALRDLRMPEARWDFDRETILCNPIPDRAKQLRLNGNPVTCVWGVFSSDLHHSKQDTPTAWTLAEPDGFEDDVCDEVVTMVLDFEDSKSNSLRPKILKLEKNGGGFINPAEVRKLLIQAEKRWQEVSRALPPTSTTH